MEAENVEIQESITAMSEAITKDGEDMGNSLQLNMMYEI